ncbi:MAG: peptidase S9, partial [Prevotellaceae bacterium]|nr:peptidase S9 [Prevotellaceae bacterium]
MKNHLYAMMIMTGILASTACSSNKETQVVIGKHNPIIEDGVYTPEIMHQFGRLSDPQVSPDGTKILYGVSYIDIAQNKSNRELFVINVDGTENQQITKTAKGETNARWYLNGSKIAYLSGGQLWVMYPDGSNPVQVSDISAGILEFTFSPDQTKILFISTISTGKKPTDRYPDLPKATGRVIDDLMYRHWDEWVNEIPHPFVADFDGKKLTNIVDLLEGEPYECPARPFGGIEQLSWSLDGTQIAYSCRKLIGVAYSKSTNTDIYLYNLASGESKNITQEMLGYDTDPTFSPDGQFLAWISMEREGYEADKQRLFVINLLTGEKIEMSKNFAYNVENASWNSNSQSLYFTSCVNALTHVYQIAFPGGAIRQLTIGRTDFDGVQQAGNVLISTFRSMFFPNELVSINPDTGLIQQLTFENKHILDQLADGKCEERWIATTDNKSMHTWILYPP